MRESADGPIGRKRNRCGPDHIPPTSALRDATASAGSSQEFDLTRYAEAVRGERRGGTRLYFLIGLAFGLGGVALLGAITYQMGLPSLEISVIVLAIFFGVGGGFFWLPIAFGRPWDTPTSLRVDTAGFELRLHKGRVVRHAWDAEGLALDIRESRLEAAGSAMPPAERLLIIPGADGGNIPREAREILLDEARRHGLAFLEEQYSGTGFLTRDASSTIVRRVVARLPFGALPPTEAWPFPEPSTGSTSPSERSFDLAKGRYRADALGLDGPVRAGTLTVEPSGLKLVRANGREQRFAFSDPKFRIGFGRRLESAVTRLDAPRGLWFLTFGGSDSGLFVSGAARTAVVGAAETARLDVRTSISSLPDRPVWRWVADTRIRAPRHNRARSSDNRRSE